MLLLSGAISGFLPWPSNFPYQNLFTKTALEPFQAFSSNQLGILGPKLVRIHSLIQAFHVLFTGFLLVQQLLDQVRAFLRLVQGVFEHAQCFEQVRLGLVVAFLQALQLIAAGLKLWRGLLGFGIVVCLHQQRELVHGAAQAIDCLLQAFVSFLVLFSWVSLLRLIFFFSNSLLRLALPASKQHLPFFRLGHQGLFHLLELSSVQVTHWLVGSSGALQLPAPSWPCTAWLHGAWTPTLAQQLSQALWSWGRVGQHPAALLSGSLSSNLSQTFQSLGAFPGLFCGPLSWQHCCPAGRCCSLCLLPSIAKPVVASLWQLHHLVVDILPSILSRSWQLTSLLRLDFGSRSLLRLRRCCCGWAGDRSCLGALLRLGALLGAVLRLGAFSRLGAFFRLLSFLGGFLFLLYFGCCFGSSLESSCFLWGSLCISLCALLEQNIGTHTYYIGGKACCYPMWWSPILTIWCILCDKPNTPHSIKQKYHPIAKKHF